MQELALLLIFYNTLCYNYYSITKTVDVIKVYYAEHKGVFYKYVSTHAPLQEAIARFSQ